MRLAVHLWRLVGATFRFSVSTRRYSVLLVIVGGLLLLAAALAAQTAAPLAVYPFA